MRRYLLDLILVCFEDIDEDCASPEMSSVDAGSLEPDVAGSSLTPYRTAAWTAGEIYMGACACLCAAMDTSVSDGNDGTDGLSARARTAASKLLGAALFAPQEIIGSSNKSHSHSQARSLSGLIPSLGPHLVFKPLSN